MKNFFRIFMVWNATSWLIGIFFLKSDFILPTLGIPLFVLGIVVILASQAGSILSFRHIAKMGDNSIPSGSCVKIELMDSKIAQQNLLMLGIVGLIPDWKVFLVFYLFVFFLSYRNYAQYMNLWFMTLGGYHFYRLEAKFGTEAFLIFDGDIIRSPSYVDFHFLKCLEEKLFLGSHSFEQSKLEERVHRMKENALEKESLS